MNKFFYDEYLHSLLLSKGHIQYKKLSECSESEKNDLAKLYLTVFNADNKEVIKSLNILGRTLKERLWNEEPYEISGCADLINDYSGENYLGICAHVSDENKNNTIGATIFQRRDLDIFLEKGYKKIENLPDDIEYWCEIDTFRRPLSFGDDEVRYIASMMIDRLVATYKKEKPVLLYSSTNNPVMERSKIGNKLSNYYRKTAPVLAKKVEKMPRLGTFLRETFIKPSLVLCERKKSIWRDVALYLNFFCVLGFTTLFTLFKK